MRKLKTALLVILFSLSFPLCAESLDYIGFSLGFDFSSKSTVFSDGIVWESNSTSVDLSMDMLVYFNSQDSQIRYGSGFSIGCGLPVFYDTVYGTVEGKKPFAVYGKASFDVAFFINNKAAIESKLGFAIRVDQLDFRSNHAELGLSQPMRLMNTGIMALLGLSMRYEVNPGIVLRGGTELMLSMLEHIELFQGPSIADSYEGVHKGSRSSIVPYLSILFSY